MPNIREWHLQGNADGATQTFELVEGSPTGRETIFAQGEFSGATVNLSTNLTLINGDTTGDFPLPEQSEYTANFAKEIAIGKGNNLKVEVTNIDVNTDIIFKVMVNN